MPKPNFTILVILFVWIFISASCDNVSPTNEASLKDSSVKLPIAADSISSIVPIAGYMDTLYIEKEVFLALNKKRLVLKFYVSAASALTLHGWQTKRDLNNDDYDLNKQIELKNGSHSDKPAPGITYGPGSFFGGVVLRKGEVDDIQDSIRHSRNAMMKFVVFAPEKDATYSGHFIYNIMLSDYAPTKAEVEYKIANHINFISRSLSIKANPSPPRAS